MLELPSYTLRDKIHEGTRTILYRGYRNADNTPIVVKTVAGEYPQPHELARFRHEYQILRSISFPGIVKAYALEKYGNGLALILEHLQGQSLSNYVTNQRLSLKQILRIAVSLADKLAFLHHHGIIHRDIKPQKVSSIEKLMQFVRTSSLTVRTN